MKNSDLAKTLIKQNEKLFLCPKCNKNIRVINGKSLVCKSKHCFDISKTGYINFLLNSVDTHYDKKLFESRNKVCKQGVFDQMITKITSLVDTYYLKDCKESSINILDVGCGEGSHLANTIEALKNKYTMNFRGLGIDIEKEAIKIASREYGDIIWCVADLAKIPFMSKQFDIVFNIFTPSNYSQFNRILKKDGILIKVIPNSNYLVELRNIFYDDTDKQKYSNEKVIKHFSDNLRIIEQDNILYTVELDRENLERIIQMTPLSWEVSSEKIQKALDMKIDSITIDLCFIVGTLR